METERRQASGISFSGVIYAHQERISIGEAIRDLERIARAGDPDDFSDHVTYLPL